MSSALRPGQPVGLEGIVDHVLPDGTIVVRFRNGMMTYADPPALTPVVEPEPQWSPGDVVRIDGVNYMLREYSADLWWYPAVTGRDALRPTVFSRVWAEGRVEVIYRKGADK